MIYQKIQEYKRNKYKKNQTARVLGINYRTVEKYWDVAPDRFAEMTAASKTRAKKADPYKDYVLDCLTHYPDISAAQVDDWIREKYHLDTLPCSERSFRSFVNSIRKEYDIDKPSNLILIS